MILSVPGATGPVPRDVPAADLAKAFWGSSWGLRTRLAPHEPTGELLTYLTAPRAQGGLQASWTDAAGLHEVRDLIAREMPGESHG